MNDAVKLYGVLVTYARTASFAATLERLRAQSRQLDHLYVVDNGGSPEARKIVEETAMAATYLDPGDNLGPAGGYALGMQVILETADDSDWIFLFDDDDPPFFDEAVENAGLFAQRMQSTNPDVGGVGISGGRFDFGSGRVIRVGDAEISGPVPVDHITGGGLPTYRVGAVRDVGAFLAELFFGFEELEYGLRLTAAGHELFADGDQWARRKAVKREAGLLRSEEESVARSKQTSRRLSGTPWRRYYSLRNMIYILRRHGRTIAAIKVAATRGLAKPLANLFTTPGPAWNQLKLNWRAIRDGFRGRLGRIVEPG